MCCCFVEDVGVHAQTLDTQPSRAPGSSVPSAPFLRHPRPATPGRQQRSPSCHSEAAQAPLCASPLGTHSHPPPARPHAALAGPLCPELAASPGVCSPFAALGHHVDMSPPPGSPPTTPAEAPSLFPRPHGSALPRCLCCGHSSMLCPCTPETRGERPGAPGDVLPTSCPRPVLGVHRGAQSGRHAARVGGSEAPLTAPSGDEGREGPAHGSRSRREAKGAGDSGRAAPPPASTRLVPPSPGWQMQPRGGGRFLLSFFFFHRWRKLIILICVTLTPLQVFFKMLGNR